MLSLTETASSTPSAASAARRAASPARRAARAPTSASSSPSAWSGSAMKLFAYTHSGVVKPSSSAAGERGPARTAERARAPR